MDAELVQIKLVQAFIIFCAGHEDMQLMLSLENYDAVLSIINTCYNCESEQENMPFLASGS